MDKSQKGKPLLSNEEILNARAMYEYGLMQSREIHTHYPQVSWRYMQDILGYKSRCALEPNSDDWARAKGVYGLEGS